MVAIADRKVTLEFDDVGEVDTTKSSKATLEVEFEVETKEGSLSGLAVKGASLSCQVPIDDIIRAAQCGCGGTPRGLSSSFTFLLREVRARLESRGKEGGLKCPR